MVIADQEHVRLTQLSLDLRKRQDRFVVAERFAEVSQILAAAVGISGLDFALQVGQGVVLARTAAA